MKPFDIEAAKRGDPIKYFCGGEWLSANFVGVTHIGMPVIQIESADAIGFGQPFSCGASILRMAPKPPRKMWVQWVKYPSGTLDLTRPAMTPELAKSYVSTLIGAPDAIGEPKQIEVPEE